MSHPPGIIIMLHCKQHTGYAIEKLELVFRQAAIMAGYSESQIFWSYPELDNDAPNIIRIDYKSDSPSIGDFIRTNNVTLALAFDLPYPTPVIKTLRAQGVKTIISYWGASISSINSGFKLLAKRLEWHIRRNKPDLFIFESKAMAKTATHGRGIPSKNVLTIPLGVDTDAYGPGNSEPYYIHDALQIPRNRKIVFYSGHMEERKGVRVIIKAAIELIDLVGISDIHFVLCGNQGTEAAGYLKLLEGHIAKNHVTFAGYRNDIPQLMSTSHIGVIASTGWDSFTMSSVEMMASGLPMIVSKLQGLNETIEDGENGFFITPGSHLELAEKIFALLQGEDTRMRLARKSRERALQYFSRDTQILAIANAIRSVR